MSQRAGAAVNNPCLTRRPRLHFLSRVHSHAMGNSSGNLSWYWRYFWDDHYPRLQGGYIWDMIDQGIRQPDVKNGKGFYFAYGGDFGEKIHDRQFCCNVGATKCPFCLLSLPPHVSDLCWTGTLFSRPGTSSGCSRV